MSLQLLRNTRIFVSTVKTGHDKTNTQEILVQDDISWGQDSNSTDITVSEAGPRPTRGSKRFNDSLNAAEWSFSTYLLPYLDKTTSKQIVPDYMLWHALSSGKPINLDGDTGAHTNETNFMVNFRDNAYHQLAMLHIYILTDKAWSYIDSCQINQAEVNVDIEDIGRVTWSGNGNQLIPLDAAPFDPDTVGIDDETYMTIQGSYIKNKLTILKIKDMDTGKAYDIPITGGSFTINNNITYLTPNVMSRVNIPIGSFTGAFELTGSLTAYLNDKALGSMDLYKDLIKTLKVVNRFEIALVLGGEYDDERPAAVLVAKQAHVNIPTIETDDVLGTSVEFKAIPTDLDTGDEGYLGFSNKYTKTTIANLIATGDGGKAAPVKVTGITVKSAGDVASVDNSATLQMTVDILPAEATNKEVTWSISSGTAATIDATSGLLTADASKTGAVTVKAVAKDGSGVEGTKSITVTASGG
ncbi:tail tube protein [Escherichia phage vB_EcoS-26175IV]|uniref:Tail tube protein n=1 Tax=Escherichia phage vB_EcoS-26175I TaxID=2576478 RepID=A0A5P1M731_9CAUD|nr:tail tube protein [Escherichia phage vB_EcoS-26175I]QDK00111.1 tail tube protein [Escherichia phage vB_EcoS-26175II]QDK00368.1 tail tube protein [Escherichia phage vB_EcoS-26175III]QDK00428.1 tail tube protein [Escherichia phage vB_EcoS-26175IV]QDK00665.1 tail tube protein [Escherichia phage vB_EcoS-26175V]WJZ69655.1 tail tube protein [Citrobacter phage YZU-L1]